MRIMLLKWLGIVGMISALGSLAMLRGEIDDASVEPTTQARQEKSHGIMARNAWPTAVFLLGGIALLVISALLLDHYSP